MVKGTCHGSTLIDRSLVIEGVRTATSGKPKLSGDGEVRVLWIKARATVRLLTLEILRGSASGGAGIVNNGKLVLRDVVVRRNVGGGIRNGGRLTLNGTSALVGNERGGIYNVGALTLNDSSRVSGNEGGGIGNRGTLTLNGTSAVVGNKGTGIYNAGTLTLNDSSQVSGNLASRGGGIVNSYLEYEDACGCCDAVPAQLTLNDASAVTGNSADFGGGIENYGTLVMDGGSRVAGNTAWTNGGGVYNGACDLRTSDVWGTVTLRGSSSIVGNAAGDGGAGIMNHGDVTLDGSSSVRDNAASGWGGGILGGRSISLLASSVVTGNRAAACGGLCSNERTRVTAACGPGGNVYGNAPDDCDFE
jgi:hypothetical protein